MILLLSKLECRKMKKKEFHSDINKAELGNGNIQCP